MADQRNFSLPLEHVRGSEDVSNSSSAAASQLGSASTSRPPKAQHRVKFLAGAHDDKEEQDNLALSDTTPTGYPTSPFLVLRDVPAPSLPAGDEEDVASISDVALTTPDWSGRANTAALRAQDRASMLASRLSHSAPGTRRNSLEDARYLSKSTYPKSDSLRPSVRLDIQSQ